MYSWRQEPARKRLGIIRYNKTHRHLNFSNQQVYLYCSIVFKNYVQSLIVYSVSGAAEFRSGKAPILIATDVASRGLGMSCVLK